MMGLSQRPANISDLEGIIVLLEQDSLPNSDDLTLTAATEAYVDMFHQIDRDPNQYLMVVEKEQALVGSCHLTILPSLTFGATKRLQIEAVRVAEDHRGCGIGEWMLKQAIAYGQANQVGIVQLTSNKHRESALQFYEKLGFQPTHEGFKLIC